MDMDAFDRELEDALRARRAAAAPPQFTHAVMRRVGSEGDARARMPRWMAALSGFCDPVGAGIMLLVLGSTLVFDTDVLAVWMEKGLAAPTPLLMAASALLISGWYVTNVTETQD
jgi:anti-sigma factor RsiW